MKRNPRKELDYQIVAEDLRKVMVAARKAWKAHPEDPDTWEAFERAERQYSDACVELVRRFPRARTDYDDDPALQNPSSGAKQRARHTAEGLLTRMKADGADTFAKKVAWVKKHMPSIDRPRTFVGWVTKGERGRVVLSRNPTPAYHRTRGDAELVLAEDSYRKAQALRRRGDASGSHDALIHAHRMAALAEADLLDGASPRAADAKRLAWWKAYSGLAADKRRNPSLNVRNPSFSKWLDTFLEEKEIDMEETLTVKGKAWGTNYMPVGVVVSAMKMAPKREQDAIKTMLVKIDFANAPVRPYLAHLAQAIAR